MNKIIAVLSALTLSFLFPSPARADPTPDPTPPPSSVAEVPLTLATLVSANPQLHNPNLIFPGQVLTIPGSEPYVVKSGDTLSKISVLPPTGVAIPPLPPETPADIAAPTPAESSGVTPAPIAVHQGLNWAAVAKCESGGNPSINTGNGFSGLYQFAPGTWSAHKLPGDPAMAWQASADTQTAVAERVLASQGPNAWPVCSHR